LACAHVGLCIFKFFFFYLKREGLFQRPVIPSHFLLFFLSAYFKLFQVQKILGLGVKRFRREKVYEEFSFHHASCEQEWRFLKHLVLTPWRFLESLVFTTHLLNKTLKVFGKHIGILIVTYSRLGPLTFKASELNRKKIPQPQNKILKILKWGLGFRDLRTFWFLVSKAPW
jgi:hypothetical protein